MAPNTRASSRMASRQVTPAQGTPAPDSPLNTRLRSASRAVPSVDREVSQTPSHASQSRKRGAATPSVRSAPLGVSTHAYGRGKALAASTINTGAPGSFGASLSNALDNDLAAREEAQRRARAQSMAPPAPRFSSQMTKALDESITANRDAEVAAAAEALTLGKDDGFARPKAKLTTSALQVSSVELGNSSLLTGSNNSSKNLDTSFQNRATSLSRGSAHESTKTSSVPTDSTAPPAVDRPARELNERPVRRSAHQPLVIHRPLPELRRGRLVLPGNGQPWYARLYDNIADTFRAHPPFPGAIFADSTTGGGPDVGSIVFAVFQYIMYVVGALMAYFWLLPLLQTLAATPLGQLPGNVAHGLCNRFADSALNMCGHYHGPRDYVGNNNVTYDVAGVISKIITNQTALGHRTTALEHQQQRTERKVAAIEQHLLHESNTYSPALPPNYFSSHLGAQVIQDLTSTTLPTAAGPAPWFFKQLFYAPGQLPAATALQPWTEAGQCWCASESIDLPGAAQLGVRTANVITANAITIEHVAQPSTLDIESAPKEMEIWAKLAAGHQSVSENIPCSEGPAGIEPSLSWVCLGRATYDITKPNHIQTTTLTNTAVPATDFVVKVLKNHGKGHTCLYRVQMHGNVFEKKKAL
ncbi:hypothetical protein EJ08DRAFT_308423 [Tothia fuscella]|uniref:SUN domain-containing protein n=1 Tax=Tothia fuscella TaxID=1048955 RepID=A0A9P4NNV2_9PEZI|nr:hypothetical protein EJ08DRAFT_308423 [Tothia fuscella]